MKKTTMLIAGLAVGFLLAPAAHAGKTEPPIWEFCTIIGPPLGPAAPFLGCDRVPKKLDKPRAKKRSAQERREKGRKAARAESKAGPDAG